MPPCPDHRLSLSVAVRHNVDQIKYRHEPRNLEGNSLQVVTHAAGNPVHPIEEKKRMIGE